MIYIENIKKNFGKKQILKNVSFSAEEGQCIGILGCNGSGKSTLFSILAGVLEKDCGSFKYGDIDLFASEKTRSDLVGYIPQNTPLFEELSAIDNLKLWYPASEIASQLEGGVLKMLGVDKFINVPVYKMSGGMKKRLSIGCSVANNPKILLLDEPSAALDLVCKNSIFNYLSEYKKSGGIVLLATHDVQELPLCDKLFILKDGELSPYTFDGDIDRLAGCL